MSIAKPKTVKAAPPAGAKAVVAAGPPRNAGEMAEVLANIERMHFLLKSLKVDQGLHSVQVARATDNYFDMSYPERVKFLGAPSVFHLCKTIILQSMEGAALVETRKTDLEIETGDLVCAFMQADAGARVFARPPKELRRDGWK